MANLPPPEIPEGHYSRLCPGDWTPHPEEKTKGLAWMMRDSKEKRARRKRTLAVPSGYVYFGPFIDHDLTRDTLSLAETSAEAEQTGNHRTPRLDLDHLFGGRPMIIPSFTKKTDACVLGGRKKARWRMAGRLPPP